MASLEILYEDNHLLALNKPAGLLTQPSGKTLESLEALAKAWIKQTKDKTGEVFLHAVHRLDKPVSGIVLFARTSKALTRMNEQMRGKSIIKVYHAVVTEDLPGAHGTLMHHLRHSRMRSVVASPDEPGSRQSLLTYRIIKRFKKIILVEVLLETGRYHQIRAQFAAGGFPILGDVHYGGEKWTLTGEIALHHKSMEFMHPTLKSTIKIEAPYPSVWPINGRTMAGIV
jgi:23S rRNA pseudouridine1911/1915/1917 synthase